MGWGDGQEDSRGGRAVPASLKSRIKAPILSTIQDFYFLSTFFSLNRETKLLV